MLQQICSISWKSLVSNNTQRQVWKRRFYEAAAATKGFTTQMPTCATSFLPYTKNLSAFALLSPPLPKKNTNFALRNIIIKEKKQCSQSFSMTQIIQRLCNYSEKLLIFEHRAFTPYRPEASIRSVSTVSQCDLGLLLIKAAVDFREVYIWFRLFLKHSGDGLALKSIFKS